jgi:hypothetical protein
MPDQLQGLCKPNIVRVQSSSNEQVCRWGSVWQVWHSGELRCLFDDVRGLERARHTAQLNRRQDVRHQGCLGKEPSLLQHPTEYWANFASIDQGSDDADSFSVDLR